MQREANRAWDYGLDRPGSAGPGTIRNAIIFAVAVAVFAVVTAVFREVRLPPFPEFVTFRTTLVFMVDGITALILFGQFIYRRLPSYCLLAAAFLFSAAAIIPYALSFPGALIEGRQFLGGTQTAIWMWHLWHIVFPTMVAVAVLRQGRDPESRVAPARVGRHIAACSGIALLLAAAVGVVPSALHDRLPVLEEGDVAVQGHFVPVALALLAATAVAFVLSLRLALQRSALYVWLTLVMFALLVMAAGNVGTPARYTVGWYFVRINSGIASSVLLVVFVTYIHRLHVQLAATTRELADTNRVLSDTVKQKDALVAELRASEEQLRGVDERKDAFIALLAHELRSPLTPIRSAAHVLARDPTKVAWAAGVIDRQIAHMARLLEDLLDISRIKRNRLELRRACVSLRDVIEAAREQSQPLLQAAGQALVLELPPDPIYLDADKTRLAQVFANLLNNAARYSPQPGRVTLGASVAATEVLVTVRDTGVGISPEKLGLIFDMFYQIESPDRHGAGGLGVGLQLAKGLVELHGGSISAHSDGPGKGSVFTIRLPIHVEPRLAPVVPAGQLEPAALVRPLRIAVVDDNRDTVDSMRVLLGMAGHEVRAAYDAGEALALAESFRPEVVLLDIGLPDMSGYECAARIRKTAWGRDALLIAVSGWGKPEDKRRAREAGLDRHFTKPVDLDELEKLLAEWADARARPLAAPTPPG